MCVSTNSNRERFAADSEFEAAPARIARPSQATGNDASMCPPKMLTVYPQDRRTT